VDTTISQTERIYPSGEDYKNSEQTVPYANKGTFSRVETAAEVVNDGSLTYLNGVYKWGSNILDAALAKPYHSGYIENKNIQGRNSYPCLQYRDSDGACILTAISADCLNANVGFGAFCKSNSLFGGEYSSTECYDYGSNYCYIGKGYAKIAEMKHEIDYMRPDGSTYSVELDSWFQVQP
jgi:hypothetical protein